MPLESRRPDSTACQNKTTTPRPNMPCAYRPNIIRSAVTRRSSFSIRATGRTRRIDQWEAEAARRGYILIAPEYSEPGKPSEYRYTASEHAAVELALRDARKRYAIDSDRVFAAGQLTGGSMAWDYALAHPDEFAGVVVISGLPAKYVPRYLPHHERLPLFYVLGEYVPASRVLIYEKYVKPWIVKAWDVTYVEYFRRRLEELPEEITPAYDWMDRHRRDPYPKAFKAYTARTCDTRFYGIVVRDFSPGRTTAPEAADVLGQNLNPAVIEMKSSTLSNQIRVHVSGIKSLDIWLSPKLIDFKRRVEIRIQDRPYFKGLDQARCGGRCSKTSAFAAIASKFTGTASRRGDHLALSRRAGLSDGPGIGFLGLVSLGTNQLEVASDGLAMAQRDRFGIEGRLGHAPILLVLLFVTSRCSLTTFGHVSRFRLGRTFSHLALNLFAFACRVELGLVAVGVAADCHAPGVFGRSRLLL